MSKLEHRINAEVLNHALSNGFKLIDNCCAEKELAFYLVDDSNRASEIRAFNLFVPVSLIYRMIDKHNAEIKTFKTKNETDKASNFDTLEERVKNAYKKAKTISSHDLFVLASNLSETLSQEEIETLQIILATILNFNHGVSPCSSCGH